MPEVGEHEQDEAVQERDAGIAGVRPEERRADRLGQAEADRAADERAEQIGDLGLAQPRLDADDDEAEQRADDAFDPDVGGERPDEDGRVRDRQHEQNTDDQMPGHV